MAADTGLKCYPQLFVAERLNDYPELWQLFQGAATQLVHVTTTLQEQLLSLPFLTSVRVQGHMGVTVNDSVTLRLFPWSCANAMSPDSLRKVWGIKGSARLSDPDLEQASLTTVKEEPVDLDLLPTEGASNDDHTGCGSDTGSGEEDQCPYTNRRYKSQFQSAVTGAWPFPLGPPVRGPAGKHRKVKLTKDFSEEVKASSPARDSPAPRRGRGRPRKSRTRAAVLVTAPDKRKRRRLTRSDKKSESVVDQTVKDEDEPAAPADLPSDAGDEGKGEGTKASRAEIDALIARAVKEAGEQDELCCPQCARTYSRERRKVFGRHVRKHFKRVQCEVCGKHLSNADALRSHQLGLHGAEKPYKCQECGLAFSFKHSYRLHRFKHTGERPYPCQHCSRSYLTASHLNTHQRACHSNEVGKSPYQCDVCGRFCASKMGLVNHSNRHVGIKPFSCTACPKSFSSKSALRLHSVSAHCGDVGQWKCELCSKFFKTALSMEGHKKRHFNTDVKEGVTQYVCDVCGRQFQFQSSLRAHASIHNHLMPFVCSLCGKAFKLQASLYSHKFTHSTERPFQCRNCPKTFKTKGSLAQHEQRHLAGRTFPCPLCPLCPATFPDKSALDKHVRTIHTPKRMFQCTLCSKAGPRQDNLRTHLKTHGKSGTAQQLDLFLRELVPADMTSPPFTHTATPLSTLLSASNTSLSTAEAGQVDDDPTSV